ncbi:hypothetical protein [Alteromonas lipolytica]|uniref:PEP-CTERM sorting domain-containing protein n=1 Tax=Alteromonas lipolytica TaxID=1856405 RepID=A0A1E8FD03_9ALTE|nr:hypothetical protein [Alteromonas lipolytica]OFI33817.1 hypothetical protein BFC17_19810 [Alteromonas lipolytica]GGF68113.1 hypothetical protein GCM10011338_20410 [Alteromonas lipolytica]
MNKIIRIMCLALSLVTSASALSSVIYHTSLSSSHNQLWKYDVATDQWSRLNDYKTGSNFAVDSLGGVYAYNGNRTGIDKYDPLTDTWSQILSAPVLGGTYSSNSYNFFNLEITNSGRFLLSGNNTSGLFYSDGGAWSSVNLGFGTAANGGYDPVNDLFAVSEFTGRNPILIDTNTFSKTVFPAAGQGGDWRRAGTILDNIFYTQTSGSQLEAWDLTNPGAGPSLITPGAGLRWMGTTADYNSGSLYAVDIVNPDFYSFDGSTWTRLANAPTGNHTTIAFANTATAQQPSVEISAPGTLAITLCAFLVICLRRITGTSAKL